MLPTPSNAFKRSNFILFINSWVHAHAQLSGMPTP